MMLEKYEIHCAYCKKIKYVYEKPVFDWFICDECKEKEQEYSIPYYML